jgi:hypothetical protein
VTDDAVLGFIASLPNATIGTEHAALRGRITLLAEEAEAPLLETEAAFIFAMAALVDDSGTVLVPLRAVAEALGATVNWIQETNTAVVTTLEGQTTNVNISEHQTLYSSTFVTTEFAAQILNVVIQADGGAIRVYHP